jgi:hypothetical protein
MPFNKTTFTIVEDDLQKIIDVDDSVGRSVPINMNFLQEGYLSKDTGFELFGAVETELCHSPFQYKKKDGTTYILRGKGTKLQSYNHKRVMTADNTTETFTSNAHGLADTTQVYVSSTLTLPTGLTANTAYFVRDSTTNTFKLALTSGGTAINITSNGTGVLLVNRVTPAWEDLSPTYTAGAEFGFLVYNDELWGCNAVEDFFKWDGTTFTTYSGSPKGNILEIFEDRMFVAGVIAEPLTTYYSNVGHPETFTSTDLIKPLGTDAITNLENYYGTLMLFKAESIWKITFIYDQVVSLFVPKLELQSNNYGACSRKAVSWVENDIWFMTGREVRAIGFVDKQIGVFGINPSVISENIKSTLQKINVADFSKVVTFYNNRRFYMGVALNSVTTNVLFVCHTLYKNAWTKYTERDKSNVNDFMAIDDIIYTTKNTPDNYGLIKWNSSLNDIDTAISSSVLFQRIEDDKFTKYRMYRYLDLLFKDLEGVVTGTIQSESSDNAVQQIKSFSLGNLIENEENTIGEVPFGQMLIADAFGEDALVSPFLKRRVSFLSKNQAILIGLSNANLNETFTICKFDLIGFEESTRLMSGRKIISIGN